MKLLNIGGLDIRTPIIQGGMGIGISLSGLASAVANQGGVGVIACAGMGMMEPDSNTNFLEAGKRALRREIRKARKATRGILGVNIMVALSNFTDMVKVALEEKIDIIFSGAGLPLNLPHFLDKDSQTRLVPIISSGRAARIIARKWMEKYNYLPDAFVVEGPLAGGHLGFKKDQLSDPQYSLDKILHDVLREVIDLEDKYGKKIPVIAAGGIYSGADIYHYLQKGAAGVQMATRFVTTYECDADISFKSAYVKAGKEDVIIIDSPVGLPGRAIKNSYIMQIEGGSKTPFKCPYHCISTCDYKNSPYCIALSLLNACRGKMKHGFAFAGKNVYRSRSIISVKQLFDSLYREYNAAARKKKPVTSV